MRARLLIATAALALTAGLTGCEAPADTTTAADAPAAASTKDKAAAADKPAAKVEPSMTAAQKNAVKSAESYIDHTAFSKAGLVDQLKYEEFSTKDAQFAVDSLDVNWKEQAALSAASYLDNGSFSKAGLIEQLEYEKFTAAEAKYGAEKAYK